MDSLATLRQFEQSSPIEVTRTLELVKEDKALVRPAFRLTIILNAAEDFDGIDRKYPLRDEDSDRGREQRRNHRRDTGAIAIRHWTGCTRENIEILSRWALQRPEAMNALPKDEEGKSIEVQFDERGRDFLMEILDGQHVDFISGASANTEAFAIEQQREKKR